MDVAAFDGSDGLDAAQVCFGRSQGSKAMAIVKEPLQGCMIALLKVVSPLSVDTPDAVKMWIIVVVYLANNTAIGRSFIRHNGDRAMEPNPLDRFVEKAFCCFDIRSRGQAESIICPLYRCRARDNAICR